MHRRQRGDHAPVALVGQNDQRAALHHAEIDPRQPNVGAKEDLAQRLAGGLGHLGDALGIGRAQLLLEKLAHVAAPQVHGGGDDVRRALTAQLDDIFAQVGFHHGCPADSRKWFSSISSETMLFDLATSFLPGWRCTARPTSFLDATDASILGKLGLGCLLAQRGLLDDLQYNLRRFLGSGGALYPHAVGLHLFDELRQENIQVVDDLRRTW